MSTGAYTAHLVGPFRVPVVCHNVDLPAVGRLCYCECWRVRAFRLGHDGEGISRLAWIAIISVIMSGSDYVIYGARITGPRDPEEPFQPASISNAGVNHDNHKSKVVARGRTHTGFGLIPLEPSTAVMGPRSAERIRRCETATEQITDNVIAQWFYHRGRTVDTRCRSERIDMAG